jgi:hypothetical protein
MPAAKVGQATLPLGPEGRDPDPGVADTPRVYLRDSTSGTRREMKLALVCGAHPNTDNRAWIVVGRDGRLLALSRIRDVRLHPATEEGADAVQGDVDELRDTLGFDRDSGWTVFVARVLVEGPWDDPTDVIPAWVVEGRERPVDLAGQPESR